MPTRDETMAALDAALMTEGGGDPAADPMGDPMGGLEGPEPGTVECVVCNTVIDTATGLPADGAGAEPGVAEMSPLDAGGPPAMGGPPAGGVPMPPM